MHMAASISVSKELTGFQWNTATLHSGKNQEQREAALASLRSGDASVLVATDLAGRGIDVQDVSLVINYQMANTIEAYVHRIGEFVAVGMVYSASDHLGLRSYRTCRQDRSCDHIPEQ